MFPTALTISHVRIPLKRAIKHASHTRTYTDSLLACCQLSNGSIGFGEGLPRDYVTGETVEGAIDLLKRSKIVDQLRATSWPQAAAAAEAAAKAAAAVAKNVVALPRRHFKFG